MATRRQERAWALQMLFQADLNPQDLAELFDEFWAGRKAKRAERAFTESLVQGTLAHRRKIDNMLQKYAQNWELSRMAILDRNVMRLALYEMLFRDDIPPVVSINEAVDLAKEYGDTQSGQFVNGILDRARKDIDRPARTPTRHRTRRRPTSSESAS